MCRIRQGVAVLEPCVLGDSKAGEESPGLLAAFAEGSTALLSLSFHPLVFIVPGSVLAQQSWRDFLKWEKSWIYVLWEKGRGENLCPGVVGQAHLLVPQNHEMLLFHVTKCRFTWTFFTWDGFLLRDTRHLE